MFAARPEPSKCFLFSHISTVSSADEQKFKNLKIESNIFKYSYTLLTVNYFVILMSSSHGFLNHNSLEKQCTVQRWSSKQTVKKPKI